jgi:hypothetical protein
MLVGERSYKELIPCTKKKSISSPIEAIYMTETLAQAGTDMFKP